MTKKRAHFVSRILCAMGLHELEPTTFTAEWVPNKKWLKFGRGPILRPIVPRVHHGKQCVRCPYAWSYA